MFYIKSSIRIYAADENDVKDLADSTLMKIASDDSDSRQDKAIKELKNRGYDSDSDNIQADDSFSLGKAALGIGSAAAAGIARSMKNHEKAANDPDYVMNKVFEGYGENNPWKGLEDSVSNAWSSLSDKADNLLDLF